MVELLDLQALRKAPIKTQPYEYLILPGFVSKSALKRISPDYPQIAQGGSFPLSTLTYGPIFEKLCRELEGPEMREIFAKKFNVDLTDRPRPLPCAVVVARKTAKSTPTAAQS